jgi:hypothetical protein
MWFFVALVTSFLLGILFRWRYKSLATPARAVLAGAVVAIILEAVSGIPRIRERALAPPATDIASALQSSNNTVRWHAIVAAVSTILFPFTWPFVVLAAASGKNEGGLRLARTVGAVFTGLLVLACSFTGYLRPIDMSNPPAGAQVPSFFRFVVLHFAGMPFLTIVASSVLFWRLGSKSRAV